MKSKSSRERVDSEDSNEQFNSIQFNVDYWTYLDAGVCKTKSDKKKENYPWWTRVKQQLSALTLKFWNYPIKLSILKAQGDKDKKKTCLLSWKDDPENSKVSFRQD